MAQTEAQVVALELERVDPKVTTLFERESTFYSQIEKRPVEIVSNRDMRIPLEIRTGGNFGHFDPAGGDLGRGDAPSYDKALMQPAFLRYAVEVQLLAHWATDDRRKAVLQNFRNLLAKSMSEFRRHCDSLCMTAGNGVVATVGSVSTANSVNTVVCDSDGFGVRLLRFGQTINVYSSNLGTNRTTGAEVKITFYDMANKTFKIPAVSGITAGDKIVVSGLSATPPSSIRGVPYHHNSASTGSWLGLDRAANPEIRGNSVSGNSAALTLPLPRLALNKVGDRLGQDQQRKVQAWMHPCQVQAYEQLGFLVTQLNSTGEGKGLDLYFGGAMQMAGAPVKKHFSWDKTRIDFVDISAWGRAVMHEPGFYADWEDGGKRLWEIRGASGGVATAMIFYIVAAFDTYINNPAAASYIDGLKVTRGY